MSALPLTDGFRRVFSVSKKTAYVTGGAAGIGLAIAKRFIEAGAVVVITDISDATDVANEIGAHFIKVDVSDENAVRASLEAASAKIGPLDIVVNNAGRADIGYELTETSSEFYDAIANVNQKGVFYGLKHAPAVMNDHGRIINTSSLAAYKKMTGTGAYSATKAAVISMTKMAALELADRQITVNAICPAYVATAAGNGEEGDQLADAFVPLGRVANTEDIVGIFHFLASQEANYITGQVIIADGGWSAGPSRNLMRMVTGRDKTRGH